MQCMNDFLLLQLVYAIVILVDATKISKYFIDYSKNAATRNERGLVSFVVFFS